MEQALKLYLRWCRAAVKAGAFVFESVGPVHEEHVQVNVEVQCRAEALDEGDGSDTGVAAHASPGAPGEEGGDLPVDDAVNLPAPALMGRCVEGAARRPASGSPARRDRAILFSGMGGVHMLGGPSWGAFRCPSANSGFMEAPSTSRSATAHRSPALDHDKKWSCRPRARGCVPCRGMEAVDHRLAAATVTGLAEASRWSTAGGRRGFRVRVGQSRLDLTGEDHDDRRHGGAAHSVGKDARLEKMPDAGFPREMIVSQPDASWRSRSRG